MMLSIPALVSFPSPLPEARHPFIPPDQHRLPFFDCSFSAISLAEGGDERDGPIRPRGICGGSPSNQAHI